MSKREIRLLLVSALRLKEDSIIWDIGAGTGTIPVEIGLICPKSRIIAIERDEDVATLIRKNCDRFGVNNVEIKEGSAPDCLVDLESLPDRVCIEGGRPVKDILTAVWKLLNSEGRIVATASNLEALYLLSEGLAEVQARNIEVVQAGINRLEKRGLHQTFAAVDPVFILSGEKI